MNIPDCVLLEASSQAKTLIKVIPSGVATWMFGYFPVCHEGPTVTSLWLVLVRTG